MIENLRLPKRLPVVALLLLGVAAVAQASWIRLPEVDLSGLEPAVARQLERFRGITQEEIGDPEAGPDQLAAAVGELGRNYHAYELSGPAEECYRIARRLTPQDFRWHYYLGYLLQNEGRLEEAASQLRTALTALGMARDRINEGVARHRLALVEEQVGELAKSVDLSRYVL